MTRWLFFLLMLLTIPAPAGAVSYTVEHAPIGLDVGLPPAVVPLSVPDAFPIAGLTVSLALGHQAFSDLHATLTSPAGTLAQLDPIPSRNQTIDEILSGTWASSFALALPISLTAFNGESAQGLWTLFVNDTGVGDFGQLRGYTLDIAPVPEPATLLLVGTGAVAFGLACRRRRRQRSAAPAAR